MFPTSVGLPRAAADIDPAWMLRGTFGGSRYVPRMQNVPRAAERTAKGARHIAERGLMRKQIELLEHHAHRRPNVIEITTPRSVGDTVHHPRTRRWFLKPVHTSQQRRLP